LVRSGREVEERERGREREKGRRERESAKKQYFSGYHLLTDQTMNESLRVRVR
jgi:hypothetical protein